MIIEIPAYELQVGNMLIWGDRGWEITSMELDREGFFLIALKGKSLPVRKYGAEIVRVEATDF